MRRELDDFPLAIGSPTDKIAAFAEAERAPQKTFNESTRRDESGLIMIGIVLVTHGKLAEEFRRAVEHVVGAQERFETVSIGAEDDMEQRRRDIIDAVARADEGRGVIILTDMFGGTPSNLAISVMDPGRVEVIAGVNLPMLIKLSGVRTTEEMPGALRDAQEAGRKYINVASQVLNGK
jgi:PTS system mannose-specific IIA component